MKMVRLIWAHMSTWFSAWFSFYVSVLCIQWMVFFVNFSSWWDCNLPPHTRTLNMLNHKKLPMSLQGNCSCALSLSLMWNCYTFAKLSNPHWNIAHTALSHSISTPTNTQLAATVANMHNLSLSLLFRFRLVLNALRKLNTKMIYVNILFDGMVDFQMASVSWCVLPFTTTS